MAEPFVVTEKEIREDSIRTVLKTRKSGLTNDGQLDLTEEEQHRVDVLTQTFLSMWEDGIFMPVGRNAEGAIVWKPTPAALAAQEAGTLTIETVGELKLKQH